MNRTTWGPRSQTNAAHSVSHVCMRRVNPSRQLSTSFIEHMRKFVAAAPCKLVSRRCKHVVDESFPLCLIVPLPPAWILLGQTDLLV
jgi:hypothetical protein